jgi:hypothetical protein
MVAKPWQDLMTAEAVFAAAQDAVADIPIVGNADLQAMAGAAVVYDAALLARRNSAPIARVARENISAWIGGAVMNMDISEEAKQAIANGQLIRARNRLRQDGCSSDDAFRKRVLLLAAERGFPPAEYAKLMRKRVPMKPISAFCKKHDVSLDWLMDGDLKGLQRMKQWKKAGMTPAEQATEILRLVVLLPLEMQQIAIHRLRQLTEGLPNA